MITRIALLLPILVAAPAWGQHDGHSNTAGVVCVHIATGKPAWRSDNDLPWIRKLSAIAGTLVAETLGSKRFFDVRTGARLDEGIFASRVTSECSGACAEVPQLERAEIVAGVDGTRVIASSGQTIAIRPNGVLHVWPTEEDSVVLRVLGELAILSGPAGEVWAMNFETDAAQWAFQPWKHFGRMPQGPAAFASSRQSVYIFVLDTVVALDAVTGAVIWVRPIRDARSLAADLRLMDPYVLVLGYDTLTAIVQHTGEVAWSFPRGPVGVQASPVKSDDRLCMSTEVERSGRSPRGWLPPESASVVRVVRAAYGISCAAGSVGVQFGSLARVAGDSIVRSVRDAEPNKETNEQSRILMRLRQTRLVQGVSVPREFLFDLTKSVENGVAAYVRVATTQSVELWCDNKLVYAAEPPRELVVPWIEGIRRQP